MSPKKTIHTMTMKKRKKRKKSRNCQTYEKPSVPSTIPRLAQQLLEQVLKKRQRQHWFAKLKRKFSNKA